MRVAFVTGGAGALGHALLPFLRERGWRVRALEHRAPVAGADETVAGDLTRPRGLEGTNAVLHLAAVTHARTSRAYVRVNVGGTEALLVAAAAAGVERFVHVSSRAASRAAGAYGRSKAESERLVRASTVAHVIVRLPEIYGTEGREGVDRLIAATRRGGRVPLAGGGDDLLCPVHVDDVLEPLVRAMEEPAAVGTTYTLAGECMTARELIVRCARAFGTHARPLPVPLAALRAGSLLARVLPLPLYPDQLERLRAPKHPATDEAYAELGFAPRGLEQALD